MVKSMVNFNYENQGRNTFLVYQVENEENLDPMGMGMLTNNNIPGLLNTIYIQMNDQKYLKFNVSAKVTTKDFLGSEINKKKLLGVLNGILDAYLSSEEYMIESNWIILDDQWMFSDVTSGETELLCIPVNEENEFPDVGSFIKKIMYNIRIDQTEDTDYFAQIINYLNSTPSFSLVDFKKVLNNLSEDKSLKKIKSDSREKSGVKPKPHTVTSGHSVNTGVKKPLERPPEMPAHPTSLKPENELEIPNESEEDPISLFYLLQHYNSENAAKYRAQKEAKKGSTGKKTTKGKEKDKDKGKIKINKPAGNADFKIPGQKNKNVMHEIHSNQTGSNGVKTGSSSTGQTTKEHAALMPEIYRPKVSEKGKKLNFGETTVLDNNTAGETTVLGTNNLPASNNIKTPFLIREKGKQKIVINKPSFRIGKERSFVDCFISDNSAISRAHANIINRDDHFYIQDTNSTNHTYVNGEVIASNVEYEIYDGDIIRLANEDFEFHVS